MSSVFATYNNDHIIDILDKILTLDNNEYLYFSIDDDIGKSYGIGTNKHVYLKLWNEIVNENMFVKKENFISINPDSSFWLTEDSTTKIAKFLVMTGYQQIVVPFRFIPTLYEILLEKSMDAQDLKYYVEIIDNELYERTKDLTSLFDTGYESIEELYLERINREFDTDENSLFLYHKISNYIAQFVGSTDYSIRDVDKKFSGNFEIDLNELLTCFRYSDVLNSDTSAYEKIWTEFIRLLTAQEIKKMLVAFFGCLKISCMNIRIVNYGFISTSVCFGDITINRKYFNIVDLVDKKDYILDSSQIYDSFKSVPSVVHDCDSSNDDLYSSNDELYSSAIERSIIFVDNPDSSNVLLPTPWNYNSYVSTFHYPSLCTLPVNNYYPSLYVPPTVNYYHSTIVNTINPMVQCIQSVRYYPTQYIYTTIQTVGNVIRAPENTTELCTSNVNKYKFPKKNKTIKNKQKIETKTRKSVRKYNKLINSKKSVKVYRQ